VATAAPERLIPLEEALERMLSGLEPVDAETVALDEAVGRVLAEPLASRLTVPPWDNSAMDGFAVRSADTAGARADHAVTLDVVGEVAAGQEPGGPVLPGTAMRILTGAIMPAGADAVVPVELTDTPAGPGPLPEAVTIRRAGSPGENVRRAGSDVRAGAPILEAGAAIRPAALAVLAATGWEAVPVRRRPRVAVLATGDELVPVGRPLDRANIYDSNSPMLAAQVRLAGGEARRLGTTRDNLADVVAALAPALSWADLVVVSGGVSVGAHDVVKQAFGELGRVDLWRVAVQPGKPLAFGRARRKGGGEVLLFGLPGNPVSSFVTFELFVRPVLRKLSGEKDPLGRPRRAARLAEPATKAPGRRAFLRVRLAPDPDRPGGWIASLAGGQGSHVLSALAAADGLAVVPEDRERLPAGADVEVWELDRGS
jgi:molybdopterin molybdotransferase